MVTPKEKILPAVAWDSHSLEEELEGCPQHAGVEMGNAPCNKWAF